MKRAIADRGFWRERLKRCSLWCSSSGGCRTRDPEWPRHFFFLDLALLEGFFSPLPSFFRTAHKGERLPARGESKGDRMPHWHWNVECVVALVGVWSFLIFTLTSSYFPPMYKTMSYKHSNTFPLLKNILFVFIWENNLLRKWLFQEKIQISSE